MAASSAEMRKALEPLRALEATAELFPPEPEPAAEGEAKDGGGQAETT